jgi:hypothetical protein
MIYVYLHGFASGPQSLKAQYLRDRFAEVGVGLQIPDLNQGNFTHLTLSRQLQQVETELLQDTTPTVLIGSSFGGLTAAWLGQRCPQVQQLVLLAPAFQFLQQWLGQLPPQVLTQWQQTRIMPFYHYGAQQQLPLSYEFVEDLHQYQEEQLTRPLPTLILHGCQDQVIPVTASRQYAAHRAWVQLVELDSDHTLGNVLEQIWQSIQNFCQI